MIERHREDVARSLHRAGEETSRAIEDSIKDTGVSRLTERIDTMGEKYVD